MPRPDAYVLVAVKEVAEVSVCHADRGGGGALTAFFGDGHAHLANELFAGDDLNFVGTEL